MKKLKMGTPAMGIFIGLAMAGAAVLMMLIGFWKALLLLALFAVGYFLGAVGNKKEFVRKTADRFFPARESKVIDIKSEISREQEERQAGMYAQAEKENSEDGE